MFKSTARKTIKSVVYARAAILLATACCAVPAWAQTAPAPTPHVPMATDTIQEGRHGDVAVTQKDPLRTGEDNTTGKPPPVYHLLGFGLSGTHRINTDALVATLPQHKGDVITSADINADVDKIHQALKAAHVHGDMTTSTMEKEGPGHWIWVIWDVHLMDALTGAPLKGPRHFASQVFTGNTKLNDAALVAASDLHPGEFLEDGRISDARTGIEQAYDKVLPGADVQARAKIKVTKDNAVSIDWIIHEPK